MHSNGSMILGKSLKLANEFGVPINFNTVILNGSILPSNFNWNEFLDDSGTVKIGRVINLCGDRDYWPRAAKIFPIKGAGDSGSFFFSENSSRVINQRLKKTNHGELLSIKNCKELWIKYLLNPKSEPNIDFEIKPHWTVRFFGWLLISSILAISGLLYLLFY